MPTIFILDDFAEALGASEAIEICMAYAVETCNAAHIAAAFVVVARAKGTADPFMLVEFQRQSDS